MLATPQAASHRLAHVPVEICVGHGVARDPSEPLEVLAPVAVVMRAAPEDEIAAQGEKAAYCYLVVSGCVRTVKLMEDGRRHVGEFLFPGDFFGGEALAAYDFSAEAVTDVACRRYPRRSLDALAANDPQLAGRLREMTAARLRASREHMVLLGRKTAAERVASFVLEMAERARAGAQEPIELPMTRADMADYLGLTIETVCRGLARLRRDGIIAIERFGVRICDRHALDAASCRTVN